MANAPRFFHPSSIMPISHAVRAGDFIFTATLGPHFFELKDVTYDADGRVLDDGSGKGDLSIEEQTHATFGNLSAALATAGCSLADVIDMTVWLSDPRDFAPVNQIYAGYFTTNQPTRTVLGTVFMFKCRIEMKALAYKPAAALRTMKGGGE